MIYTRVIGYDAARTAFENNKQKIVIVFKKILYNKESTTLIYISILPDRIV